MWEVSISVYFQWQCILRLHCHWKPSQSGAVLKIALCWPLAGSIYTAFIKAVRVLSIFDLKDGMSGSVSHNIYSSWRSIYDLFCWQKKCTGRHKNTRNAVTLLWYRCHVFLGLKRTSSALGTARLQHGFGSISFTLADEKVLSWFHASSLYENELGQHSTA